MSNSSLVSYTRISPNRTSPRNHEIDTVTVHCVVGQLTAKQIADLSHFVNYDSKNGASCNYAIGLDGSVALIVDEGDRSWCSSSRSNDHRAITIEVASDKTPPYAVTEAAYNALILLLADICRRNPGIKNLRWCNNKSLIGNTDMQNMTVHRWFAATECPGEYLYTRMGKIASDVNDLLDEENKPVVTSGTQAASFVDMDDADIVGMVGPLFTEDQKKTGVLASVSAAQFILESGYGKSELAKNANNCFGMKESLSGNTWDGSVWDGNVYEKITSEWDGEKYINIVTKFRKYSCVELSIEDHSAYLTGAMNGNKLRYEGLKGCTDYRRAVQIIKDGGYATAPDYVDKLCTIIEKWNLTQYDYKPVVNSYPDVPFKVQVLIGDLNYRSEPSMNGIVKGQTGKGTFTIVDTSGDWGKLKSGAGWIYLANPEYCTILEEESDTPFSVKVTTPNLNIRTGPGTNYSKTGKFTGLGTFTIIEVSDGTGSENGWGKLKSGAGWISLDFATRV